jgi:hypothetical protein
MKREAHRNGYLIEVRSPATLEQENFVPNELLLVGLKIFNVLIIYLYIALYLVD